MMSVDQRESRDKLMLACYSYVCGRGYKHLIHIHTYIHAYIHTYLLLDDQISNASFRSEQVMRRSSSIDRTA